MSDTTKISWTDKTWSPWQGCTKVSPGCDHCYAENIADTRFHIVEWGAGKPRKHTETWESPRRWQKQAAKEGRTIRVFPSMCDPFDNEVPTEWRTRFFNLIRETPNLTWLILTKRIGNANKMLRESGAITRNGIIETPLPNLWLGATCVNQEEANRDIPKLLGTLAAKRFVSIEPMLGSVDLTHIREEIGTRGRVCWRNTIEPKEANGAHAELVAALGEDYPYERLDWVIAGGESGHEARPAHPDWFRSLRDQCAAAGVPFHFKQWGEWKPAESIDELRKLGDEMRSGKAIHVYGTDREHDGHFRKGDQHLRRIGVKAAGRTLDGREHLEFPQ
jgi:protein gp37